MTDELGELPSWWQYVCPTNLDQEMCRSFLRPPIWHRVRDNEGVPVIGTQGRRYTFAEQYIHFAERLAKLWHASREKADLAASSPDWYGKWTDHSWIYNWADEYCGPLPYDIALRVTKELASTPDIESLISSEERWSWEKLTSQNSLYPAPLAESLLQLLGQHPIETVHYIGWLDDAICQGIVGAGRYKLTGLSQYGRYEYAPGYRFDNDLALTFFDRPPWLTGIALYQEGAPKLADVWIRDCPWDSPTQLAELLDGYRARLRMTYLVLIGEAVEHGRHPYYDWKESSGVHFGVLQDKHLPALTDEEREMYRDMDRGMRGES